MDSRPINSLPFRAVPEARESEKQETNRMISMNVIEPAQTEWPSTFFFALKKAGNPFYFVYCGKLNAVSIRDLDPIPRMDECINSLADAMIFSTFDTNSRYRGVEITKEDRDKSASTSHHGVLHCTCIPFGLKYAPGTFQRPMDVLLTKLKWQFVLAYCRAVVEIDTIFIFNLDAGCGRPQRVKKRE